MKQEVQFIVGGGGFFVAYLLGIVSVVQQFFELDKCIFAGSSAGCIPALALAADIPMSRIINTLLEISNRCNDGIYDKIYNYLSDAIKQNIDQCTINKVNNRLYICVTEVPAFKTQLINSWESVDDLTQCILCSSYIPIILGSKLSLKYKGKNYVDGDLLRRLPKVNDSLPILAVHKRMWRKEHGMFIYPTSNVEYVMELIDRGISDSIENLSYFTNFLEYKKISVPKTLTDNTSANFTFD
jgi:hypothetical protein